ncbi:hypothetical protein SUNI508_04208 [Seiridium unicorne]|uniref:Uncharacterized protein n=1 Tax=Seiridium unicorne TaxID=138068 RepID=A0ABR2V9U3_9PEZI
MNYSYDAPEAVPSPQKEVNHKDSPQPEAIYVPHLQPFNYEQTIKTSREPQSPSKIWGMPKSTFWVLVLLAAVVIAASVGGGVGASLAVATAQSRHQCFVLNITSDAIPDHTTDKDPNIDNNLEL